MPMRAAHGLVSYSHAPRALRGLHALVALVALALAAGACASCMREGPPVVAPVDVTIETGDASAVAINGAASTPPPRSRDHCSTTLRAAPIKTNPGCTLDERISHGNGTLYYPCSGDGPVLAVFGEHRFEGQLAGTILLLALKTELDWDDGCHWETRQFLRGEWQRGADSGEKQRAKLSWSYSEQPVSGTRCMGTCKASADIQISAEEPAEEEP